MDTYIKSHKVHPKQKSQYQDQILTAIFIVTLNHGAWMDQLFNPYLGGGPHSVDRRGGAKSAPPTNKSMKKLLYRSLIYLRNELTCKNLDPNHKN